MLKHQRGVGAALFQRQMGSQTNLAINLIASMRKLPAHAHVFKVRLACVLRVRTCYVSSFYTTLLLQYMNSLF